MSKEIRNLGLSLGADLCWPAAFEEIMKEWDLSIDYKGREISFDVERVTVEPFNLQYKPKYDVVLDRVTHWYHISREWIKKITLMDNVYVLNNPWAIQSVEKHTSYCFKISQISSKCVYKKFSLWCAKHHFAMIEPPRETIPVTRFAVIGT